MPVVIGLKVFVTVPTNKKVHRWMGVELSLDPILQLALDENGFFSRHQSVLECFQHQVCSWISRPDSPRHPSSELSYWQLSYKCAWYPAGRMMLRSDYHSRMEQPKYRHDSLPSHYISFVGDHYDCGATLARWSSMNEIRTSASWITSLAGRHEGITFRPCCLRLCSHRI